MKRVALLILAAVMLVSKAGGDGDVKKIERKHFRRVAEGCGVWRFAGVWKGTFQEVLIVKAELDTPGVSVEVEQAQKTAFDSYIDSMHELIPEGKRIAAVLNGNVSGAIVNGIVASSPDYTKLAPHPGENYYFCIDNNGAKVRTLDIDREDVGKTAPDSIQYALCSWPYYGNPILQGGMAYDQNVGFQHPLALERHPRSIIGCDREGKSIYLIVIKGRDFLSAGMTLPEAGQFLAERMPEIDSAVNLDGGFSCALVVDGKNLAEMMQYPEYRTIPNCIKVICPIQGTSFAAISKNDMP